MQGRTAQGPRALPKCSPHDLWGGPHCPAAGGRRGTSRLPQSRCRGQQRRAAAGPPSSLPLRPRHPAAQTRPGGRRHPAAQPKPRRRRQMHAMTASACHPAAQPGPGRRRRGCSMAASARHPAAQPRPERRRWGRSRTASAAQYPGSWSRKGGASRTGSQVPWGAGWPLASWASRVETRRWRAGTAAGEDVVAGVMSRPPLSCVKQSATSGTMPAPGHGGGRGRHDY